MKIINVESHVFERMLSGFEQFAEKVEGICQKHNKAMNCWLDNQEVCQILNISPRTLQTYRDNGTLPFSQINHKMFYKQSDVAELLKRQTKE